MLRQYWKFVPKLHLNPCHWTFLELLPFKATVWRLKQRLWGGKKRGGASERGQAEKWPETEDKDGLLVLWNVVFYDRMVRKPVKLNSGLVWSWKAIPPSGLWNLTQTNYTNTFSNCAVKPEWSLVYVCDRVFTLPCSPVPSDMDAAAPPTAQLMSRYLSVLLISVTEDMCFICAQTCVGMRCLYRYPDLIASTLTI